MTQTLLSSLGFRPSSADLPQRDLRRRRTLAQALVCGLLLAATLAQAAPGDIHTTAGTGGSPGDTGDGGPATAAQMRTPSTAALDPITGALFVADTGNDKIRRIDTGGTITTVAGSGAPGYAGDNGPASAALLRGPSGIAVDENGAVFIADTGNDRVRRIDPVTNIITTYAGTGIGGSTGDGGLATAARINAPHGITIGSDGSLFIADHANDRIRKVDPAGIITTVAGTGVTGFSGDGGLATAAKLDHPVGVALDFAGALYIADRANHRIRKVDTSGVITTVAGNGTSGFNGDNIAATSARLASPSDVMVSPTGVLFIADSNNHRIRTVDSLGTITTFAGTGTGGYLGDGGPATAARLRHPTGLAVALSGATVIVDELNHVLRAVESTCGNGTIDAGEVCDLGSANGTPSVCCAAGCGLRASGDVCRAAAALCDSAESCDGVSPTCPSDVVAPAGTLCRAAADVCDTAEQCDGTSNACPTDGFVGAGTLCRGSAGPCDRAETCTGSSGLCPSDAKEPLGEVCRAPAGDCDPAEVCTGLSNDCPADELDPAGTLCRAAAGLCDVAETCDGAVATCPVDEKVTAGTPCRPSTGLCDPEEQCTGAADACPADVSSPDVDSDDACDDVDNCVGTSNPTQDDGDTDGVGDACDNCLTTCNPDQTDTDEDTAGGDACDACPAFDQAAQAPACATAGPTSALACCLPAGSAAEPVDQDGDSCAMGGTAVLASADESSSARIPAGVASSPIAIGATALTVGALGVDADAAQIAAATLFTPDDQSFVNPLALCVRWPDAEPDGIADGSGVAAADLRPGLVADDGSVGVIAGRCADQPCGALDVDGFPTSWGGGTRTDIPALDACCTIAERRWCFEATSLGRYALLGSTCAGATGVKVKVGGLGKPAGKQSLFIDGDVVLDHPFAPALDPVARGLVVVIRSATGANLLEIQIPGGAYDAGTGQGWTLSGSLKSARWRSKLTVEGLHLAKLSWTNRREPGEVAFQVKGKAVSLPLTQADLPITAQVRLDTPEELTGQCATVAFPGPPQGLGCLLSGSGTRLLCR